MDLSIRMRVMCDVFRNLVPFVQFKKRENHPWRNVNFSTKINTPPWVFFTFFKLYKCYQNRATHQISEQVFIAVLEIFFLKTLKIIWDRRQISLLISSQLKAH